MKVKSTSKHIASRATLKQTIRILGGQQVRRKGIGASYWKLKDEL